MRDPDASDRDSTVRGQTLGEDSGTPPRAVAGSRRDREAAPFLITLIVGET
jgi:hypothetical protein